MAYAYSRFFPYKAYVLGAETDVVPENPEGVNHVGDATNICKLLALKRAQYVTRFYGVKYTIGMDESVNVHGEESFFVTNKYAMISRALNSLRARYELRPWTVLEPIRIIPTTWTARSQPSQSTWTPRDQPGD